MIDNSIDRIINRIRGGNPINQIQDKEFNDAILKFGSFVSILKNKRINQTMLFVIILEDPHFLNAFQKISEVEEKYDLISEFITWFLGSNEMK